MEEAWSSVISSTVSSQGKRSRMVVHESMFIWASSWSWSSWSVSCDRFSYFGARPSMSWRPSSASAKSSQSSRDLSGTGRVRSTATLGLAGFWGAVEDSVSCFGGLAEEGVHLPDLREDRVRVSGSGWVPPRTPPPPSFPRYASSEPSSRLALPTGQNHRAHQASIRVFSRQYGVPGDSRSKTIWSRGIASTAPGKSEASQTSMARLISRSEMRRRSVTRYQRYSARPARACSRWT